MAFLGGVFRRGGRVGARSLDGRGNTWVEARGGSPLSVCRRRFM